MAERPHALGGGAFAFAFASNPIQSLRLRAASVVSSGIPN
jgi:hypothetical protein